MGGRYIIGITGASGSLYGEKVIRRLLAAGCEVHVCITQAGQLVTREELPWSWPDGAAPEAIQAALRDWFGCGGELVFHDIHAVGASIASGSFRTDGMAVVPCSMGTLSAIAHGASHNLLERAADVVLKERRRLVLAVRETPLSTIHLQNMLALSQCGATIMPACPSFYHAPDSLDELADFFAARLLDQFGLSGDDVRRWTGM